MVIRDRPLCPHIPSSRLDQHGAHGVALKAVRPRLRLRALRLDRDAAHAPAPKPAGTTKKTASTHPNQQLDRPRSYMDEPWIEYYNTRRRHSALGGLPPISRLSPT